MFMYVRLITESEDTRLFVSRTRRRQKRSIGGVREGHTRILSATLVQYSVLLSLSASSSSYLLSQFSPLRTTRRCHEQVLYPGDVSYA